MRALPSLNPATHPHRILIMDLRRRCDAIPQHSSGELTLSPDLSTLGIDIDKSVFEYISACCFDVYLIDGTFMS